MIEYSRVVVLIVLLVGIFLKGEVLDKMAFAMDPIDMDSIDGGYELESVGTYYGEGFLSQYLDEKPVGVADVLGEHTGNRRIEVDLTNQRVYAYEGGNKVYDFLVSTGKWGRTPTGTFRIWGKFKYTKMSGGNKALGTYYYLPNVPFVMFFENDEIPGWRGFSLHGTYWHNNFGTPMSHGCVNMKTEDARTLYYWTSPGVGDKNYTRASEEDPGTEIVIYGKAPK